MRGTAGVGACVSEHERGERGERGFASGAASVATVGVGA
jgi:hypothetical protein